EHDAVVMQALQPDEGPHDAQVQNQNDHGRQPIEAATIAFCLIVEGGRYKGFLGRARHGSELDACAILNGNAAVCFSHYENSYRKVKYNLLNWAPFPRIEVFSPEGLLNQCAPSQGGSVSGITYTTVCTLSA